MERSIRFLLTLITLTIIFSISASLVGAVPLEDWGNTTYDPNTNFEWLDLTLTNGISPNAALGGFGGYVTVDGFRIATQTEVFQLFLDGGMTAVDSVARASDYLDAQTLVGMLGATAGTASQGWSVWNSIGPTYIEPFVEFNSVASTGRAYPGGATTIGSNFIAGVGVFLVRQASVPEPASLLLVGLGLICLAKYARRLERS